MEWEVIRQTPKEEFRERVDYYKILRYRREFFNNYQYLLNFIREMYPDRKRVLDVGVGLGNTSSLLQSSGYLVTAMDKFSLEVKRKLECQGIRTINDYLTTETDISEYDLVVGFHSCGATEKIIRNCASNDTDFVVVPCEKRISLEGQSFCSQEEYLDYLIAIDSEIRKTSLPYAKENARENYNDVLYLKRRK